MTLCHMVNVVLIWMMNLSHYQLQEVHIGWDSCRKQKRKILEGNPFSQIFFLHLIDFNGISTCIVILCLEVRELFSSYIYIYFFFVIVFLEYKYFLNSYIISSVTYLFTNYFQTDLFNHFFIFIWASFYGLHLVMRLLFWNSGECGIFLLLPLLSYPLWLGMVISVRFLSMDQVDLIENY